MVNDINYSLYTGYFYMDYRKIKGTKHYVYKDRDEFIGHMRQERGLVPEIVENWRDAQMGDWVLADDGGIVQILKRGTIKHPHDRKNYKFASGWVRTVVGTFLCRHTIRMDTDFSVHPNRYRFNAVTDQQSHERRKSRPQLSKQEVIFAASLCAGKKLQESYEEAFGPHADWRTRAIFLLRRDRIKNLINKNIEEIAAKHGITHEYILEMLKELLETTRQDQVKLSILRELAEWIGGKSKEKQITRGEVHVLPPIDTKVLAKVQAEKVEALSEGELRELDGE
jgi:hypothetical protein